QVCEVLRGGGTRHFDDESMVPYATNDRTWISYDDQESVAIKVSMCLLTFKNGSIVPTCSPSKPKFRHLSQLQARWILAQNFSGTMTFSLNSDDWQGTCGHGAFPLQKSILEAT
ncbi:unnamed protein product, partial [Ixodes pacificus]